MRTLTVRVKIKLDLEEEDFLYKRYCGHYNFGFNRGIRKIVTGVVTLEGNRITMQPVLGYHYARVTINIENIDVQVTVTRN